jgi:hypothetical protein
MLDREFDQRVRTAEIEFDADIGAVVFDGAGADAQFGGDLFAGLVFGQQAQHAPFGARQAVKPRWLWRRGSGAAATLYAINHYPNAEVYIA